MAFASAGANGRTRLLLLGDTRRVGHHGSSSVVKVILDQCGRRGIDIVSSIARPDLVRDLLTDPAAGARQFRSQSVAGIIINGEGALHRRSEHAVRFAAIATAARSVGLPCFVVNSVLDDCPVEVIEGLRQASAMFLREGLSKARADAAGIPARFCPDLTFALEIPAGLSWQPGERVVVSDTTVAAKNRELHAFAKRNGFTFLPLRGRPEIVSYRDRKSIARAGSFALRHHLGRWFSGSFQADRYGQAEPGLVGFLNQISQGTRLFISGRFHGVCLGLKLGVPFLAISSNTPKIEGMLGDAGFDGRMLSLGDLQQTGAALDKLLASGSWSADDERRRLAYLQRAQAAISECFDLVAGTVMPDQPQIIRDGRASDQ